MMSYKTCKDSFGELIKVAWDDDRQCKVTMNSKGLTITAHDKFIFINYEQVKFLTAALNLFNATSNKSSNNDHKRA